MANPEPQALRRLRGDNYEPIFMMKVFGSNPRQVVDLLVIGREASAQEVSVYPPQIEGYECRELIAEGGMGTVWRAVQLGTEREVALKIVAPGVSSSAQGLARFLREVSLTARLEHPHITRIYDSGVHQGLYYYAMEFVPGRHLDRYVQHGDLTQQQVVKLFDHVCAAVQYAHQHGIIHRDLKPSNILVTSTGQVRVLDFGLAKALQADDPDNEVSLSGEAIGTLTTMSPEQAAGDPQAADTRADVYALSAILYRLLLGDWPYDTSGPRDQVLHRIRTVEALRPRRIKSHFDRDLEAVLLKGLEKEPDQRYQSVAELRRDLNCWLLDWPISAKSHSSIYLLKKIVRRHRYASASVALMIVIVMCFGCLSFWSALEARRTLAARQRLNTLGNQIVGAQQDLAAEVRTEMQQHAFGWFLLAWHQHRSAEAEQIRTLFPASSPYVAAANFLLDQSPLAEKEVDLRKALGPDGRVLAQFVMGEHYLFHGQGGEALAAYEQCDLNNSDGWTAQCIRARIQALQE